MPWQCGQVFVSYQVPFGLLKSGILPSPLQGVHTPKCFAMHYSSLGSVYWGLLTYPGLRFSFLYSSASSAAVVVVPSSLVKAWSSGIFFQLSE